MGRAGVLAGARLLLSDGVLFRPFLLGLAAGEMAFQALVVVFLVAAATLYDGDPGLVGCFLGAFGLGAAVGTLGVVPALARFASFPMAAVSLAAQSALLWLLVPVLPPPGVVGVMFGLGLANPFANAPVSGLLTVRTPPHLRTQALAAFMTVVMAAGPIGLLVGGAALERFGPVPVFGAIAVLATLAYGFAIRVLLRSWRRERGAAAERRVDAVG